jgi:hypothetical protein
MVLYKKGGGRRGAAMCYVLVLLVYALPLLLVGVFSRSEMSSGVVRMPCCLCMCIVWHSSNSNL